MAEKKISEMNDKQIWSEFKAAHYEPMFEKEERGLDQQLKECCRVIRLLREIGLKYMWVHYQDRRFEAARLNYCPECGRKL